MKRKKAYRLIIGSVTLIYLGGVAVAAERTSLIESGAAYTQKECARENPKAETVKESAWKQEADGFGMFCDKETLLLENKEKLQSVEVIAEEKEILFRETQKSNTDENNIEKTQKAEENNTEKAQEEVTAETEDKGNKEENKGKENKVEETVEIEDKGDKEENKGKENKEEETVETEDKGDKEENKGKENKEEETVETQDKGNKEENKGKENKEEETVETEDKEENKEEKNKEKENKVVENEEKGIEIKNRKKEKNEKKRKRFKAVMAQGIFLSKEDKVNLLRIVEAEATGEDLLGKMLVASVVLNRVKNDNFPSNVTDVIFQNKGGCYQFSPVKDGRFYQVKISEQTKEAVKRVLSGEDYSNGALYFMARKRASANGISWFDSHLTSVLQHGGHEFFI